MRAGGSSGSIVCTGGVQYSTSLLGASAIFNPLMSTVAVSADLSTAAKLEVTAAFSSLIGSPSAVSAESSIVQEN